MRTTPRYYSTFEVILFGLCIFLFLAFGGPFLVSGDGWELPVIALVSILMLVWWASSIFRRALDRLGIVD